MTCSALVWDHKVSILQKQTSYFNSIKNLANVVDFSFMVTLGM